MMRKFINLLENTEIDPNHVEKMVRYAFNHIGLEIHSRVLHDEATGRINVRIESDLDGVSIKKLNRLYESGLSQEYQIEAWDSFLTVTFIITPNVMELNV